MEPQRWRRIKGIFQQALELGAPDRTGYLDEACGADAALRRELEALLANHRRAGDFIEAPAFERLDRRPGESPGSLVGRRLGAYRVLRHIGYGGMGDVYLAERTDDAYRQRVAVKLIKIGMDSAFLVERFRQERQILANLDHPSIARLLDGGTLEDGRPYLVMDYIEGRPIHDYCDRHDLSVRARLELFRRVCDAVQHAHRNLVIHRDLKPSNILVSESGVPKLLDFGTAKLLEGSDSESPATATGLRLLTPGYASPEQLMGGPVTTASDVYALGVVLFELLAGRRPYRFQDPLSLEAVRMVCEEEPPRPSRVARHEGRGWRELEGDLDEVVLMALRKEPEKRYGSVEPFSEDLRRHLDDLPVTARSDALAYRAGKFARRHRAGVAIAALVFLILAGAVVATTRQARRAERELARAEEVSGFLTRLFEMSDPHASLDEDVRVREMLDRGAERILSDLSNSPGLQASLLDTMGFAYHRLGLNTEAGDLLEKALALTRPSLSGERHETLASILSHLGKVHQDLADHESARKHFEQALRWRRQVFGPGNPEVARSLDDLAQLHYDLGEHERAQELHEEALTLLLASSEAREEELAENLNNLGSVLRARGELEEAEQKLREALEIRRRIFGEDDAHVASTENNLAVVLWNRGRLDEAAELFESALLIEQRLHLGEDHRHVGTLTNNLAALYVELGRFSEAEALHEQTLESRLRLLGPRHPDVAFSLNNLATYYYERGRYEEAVKLYRRALEVWSETAGMKNEHVRYCLNDLGWALYKAGEFQAAIREFRRMLALWPGATGAEDLEGAKTLVVWGCRSGAAATHAPALPFLRQALETRSRILGEAHELVVELKDELEECEQALANKVRSRRLLTARAGMNLYVGIADIITAGDLLPHLVHRLVASGGSVPGGSNSSSIRCQVSPSRMLPSGKETRLLL